MGPVELRQVSPAQLEARCSFLPNNAPPLPEGQRVPGQVDVDVNDQPASRQFHDRIRIGRRRRGVGSAGRVAHPGLDELDFLGNALRRRRAVDGLGLRQLLQAADQVIAAPEDSDVALGSPGLDDRVRGHVGGSRGPGI